MARLDKPRSHAQFPVPRLTEAHLKGVWKHCDFARLTLGCSWLGTGRPTSRTCRRIRSSMGCSRRLRRNPRRVSRQRCRRSGRCLTVVVDTPLQKAVEPPLNGVGCTCRGFWAASERPQHAFVSRHEFAAQHQSSLEPPDWQPRELAGLCPHPSCRPGPRLPLCDALNGLRQCIVCLRGRQHH
jgi:hypothetical protein